MLGDVDMSSSLATCMSVVAELLEVQIDAVAANGVRWGSCSALVAAVSDFLKLDIDLEVLRSGHNAGLKEGEVDALWFRVRVVTDSLVLHVPSLVAYNPPNSVGE
jgi:hypothetical protein